MYKSKEEVQLSGMTTVAIEMKTIDQALSQGNFLLAEKWLSRAALEQNCRSEIECRYADIALARGKLSGALQHLNAAIEANKNNAHLLLKKASVLRAMYRDHDAARVLADAQVQAPNNVSVRLAQAQLAATMGNSKMAETLYNINLSQNPYHPATLIGRIDTALATKMEGPTYRSLVSETRALLVEALIENPARKDDYKQALGDLAFRTRDWNEALAHWRDIGLDGSRYGRRTLQIAQCYLFLLDDSQARHTISLALENNPTSIHALQFLAELELSLGNAEKSIEIRQTLFTLESLQRISIGIRLAQDLLLIGQQDQASELQLKFAALPHERLEVNFVKLLMNQGRAQEACEYALPWLDCIEQSHLVASLFKDLCQIADGPESASIREKLKYDSDRKKTAPFRTEKKVRDLLLSQEPDHADIMQARQNLRIAWQVHVQSRPIKDGYYKEWQDRAFRSTSSTHLFVPTPKISARELEQLIDPEDFDILKPYMDQERAILFACSHQGPFTNHVIRLYFPKIQMATLKYTNNDSGKRDDRNFPLQKGREEAAIGLVKAVQRGESIILPVDNGSLSILASKTSSSSANGELFGIETSIPDTIPRLAAEFSIPSFWVYSNWRKGRLRYNIDRLPDPKEGEAKQDWHNRWAQAYLQHLEDAMRGEPENITLTAPMWRHLLLNSDKK